MSLMSWCAKGLAQVERIAMKRFIAGADRGQSTLLPECLDDFIDESNPVRVIDAFVDALDLGKVGFDGVVPKRRVGLPASTAASTIHSLDPASLRA